MEKNDDNEKKKEGEVVEGVWKFSVDTPPKDIVRGTSSASGAFQTWEEEATLEIVQTIKRSNFPDIEVGYNLEKGASLRIERKPTEIRTVITKKKRGTK